ncbi:STAS domain-containing protein [Streptomyces sp. NPDC051704]|uniref:STAS domain-containing protein n=1 Tax=Streptomyces sp. NPDC051704 TaxID=3365671 RepID=UPI0037924ACE
MIACSGDFDQATLEPLRRACARAVADPAVRRIVLDVSRVTFVDSSMLDAMLHLQRSGRLVLVGPLPRLLAQVLEITLTSQPFTIAGSVEEARTL